MLTFPQTLRNLAHEHDDMQAFHAAFVVLTLLIAALFNLGLFALLIAAHMSLDIVKYREVHHLDWRLTLRGVLRESLVDIFLLCLGLFLAVYFHHTAGIVAVSGLMIAEGTIAKAIGLFLSKIEILYHIVNVFTSVKTHLRDVRVSPMRSWTIGEQMLLSLSVIAVLAVTFSSYLLQIPGSELEEILVRQLVPWAM